MSKYWFSQPYNDEMSWWWPPHTYSSFFFIIITIIVFLCTYIHIDTADKHTKCIIIGSNRASSSSEFFVYAYVWLIFVRLRLILTIILRFFHFFLINLPNRHQFLKKKFINHVRVFTVFIQFLRIVCNVFDNRSLMFIFNSMIISLGNKEKRKPSNNRTIDVYYWRIFD